MCCCIDVMKWMMIFLNFISTAETLNRCPETGQCGPLMYINEMCSMSVFSFSLSAQIWSSFRNCWCTLQSHAWFCLSLKSTLGRPLACLATENPLAWSNISWCVQSPFLFFAWTDSALTTDGFRTFSCLSVRFSVYRFLIWLRSDLFQEGKNK